MCVHVRVQRKRKREIETGIDGTGGGASLPHAYIIGYCNVAHVSVSLHANIRGVEVMRPTVHIISACIFCVLLLTSVLVHRGVEVMRPDVLVTCDGTEVCIYTCMYV